MKYVKWGIVGTGTIANKFAQAVVIADNSELVAVASRKLETAQAFAQKYNIKTCFSSYKELAEFDGVDAVYIALPHTYHASHTKLFVQAGKHVLCEKPITVNEKELLDGIATAKGKSVFVMEALWTRFLPIINKIKEVIDEGVIGDVLEVSADFCYNFPDRTNQLYDNARAGGSLLDVGVYGINFASIFLGENVTDIKVSAYINEGVDERLNALISYEGGKMARISSAISLQKPESAYIYGSKGYIFVPTFYGASEFEVNVDGYNKKYIIPFKGNGFEEEIEECNKCILSGKTQSDIMPLSRSLFTMKIMDDIRKKIGVFYDADKI